VAAVLSLSRLLTGVGLGVVHRHCAGGQHPGPVLSACGPAADAPVWSLTAWQCHRFLDDFGGYGRWLPIATL
jgi:hypothetical protein